MQTTTAAGPRSTKPPTANGWKPSPSPTTTRCRTQVFAGYHGPRWELLITCGMPTDHPAIIKGVKYLLAKQEPEGCWWGRWGCNYLYGTWQALGGLTYAGLPKDHPTITKAIAWVKSVQNQDGGFGETANSYVDRRDGPPSHRRQGDTATR